MSVGLILLVTVIYFGVAIAAVIEKKYGAALMFAAYATANIGLIWSWQ